MKREGKKQRHKKQGRKETENEREGKEQNSIFHYRNNKACPGHINNGAEE
jgi:hypothetical protein